jgi:hypothetical protein
MASIYQLCSYYRLYYPHFVDNVWKHNYILIKCGTILAGEIVYRAKH